MTPRLQSGGAIARYFSILIIGSILPLILWAAFKVGFEHHFAVGNSGYPGFVAGSTPEVLFLGSSHTRLSYDIPAIEAAIGRSSYALAYGALDFNFMNMLLEDMLPDPARRPRVLVLEAYSARLARAPDLDDPRLFFDVPPAVKLKMLANYLETHPSFSSRLDLIDLVVNRGTEQVFTYPINRRILADLSYKGTYQGHVFRGVSEQEFHLFVADIAGPQADPIQLAALHHLIALCKQYGVRVLVAESPMPRPVESKPEVQSLKSVFRRFCAENNLPYLDGDQGFPVDDPDLFADAGHLSTAGRALYTTNFLAHFGPMLAKHERLARGQAPTSSPGTSSR